MNQLNIRKATQKDLEAIVQMLADDPLGKTRENDQLPLSTNYIKAWQHINADPNQELMIVENTEKSIIGTMQLSFIQYLTYQGGIRAQIEAVRIHKNYRGQGIGRELFEWAIQRAQDRGAHVLQLTTDKKRPDALAFYQSLGFHASHEGMKLHF